MMQAELQEVAKRGAKFLEVRLDFLAKAIDYPRLIPFKQAAWLATIRRPIDGGRWSGTETDRQVVLRQAIVAGCFDWIDLETDIADGIRRFGSVKRVISYHNMVETPADLEVIYDRMRQQDGDVYKLAVMPQSVADVARIIAIQKRATKPTICFGMGELGFPTRFTALKFGAPWIYALFNKDRSLAPGMPALSDFRTTYPIRKIDAATKFFGVVGDPVVHSLSPVLHNHLFQRNRINAFYVPCRVPAGQMPDMAELAREVPFDGLSITIPHKENAAALPLERDSLVDALGAANTLAAKGDGSQFLSNTDYPAILESLRARMDAVAAANGVPPREFGTLGVLVLGAGGAARAAATALHRAGATVTIASRTAERATALATQIGCKAVDWVARHGVTPCDVLINATPVGLAPKTDESPIHVSFLRPELTVFDTVYNPEQTLLIRESQARGCTVVTGVEMFVRQAAKQFELFAGVAPELDAMRDIVRKAMSPLTSALDDEAAKSGMAD